MEREEKQKAIDEIEFRIKAIALREKYNSKQSVVGAIKTAIEVRSLFFKAYNIAAQPTPKFRKGIAVVGENKKEEVFLRKK